MSENKQPTPEEIIRMRTSGASYDMELTRKAKDIGGYILLHAPLPFQIPLNDGFRYGWDDDEARYLELIHYPDNGVVRIGEPIFHQEPYGEGVPAKLQNLYTVARFGMPLPLAEIDQLHTFEAHPDTASLVERWPSDPFPVVSESLGKLLDEGIRSLNFLIRSQRILTKDPFIRPIDGTGRLPFILRYTVWDTRKAYNLAFGVGCLKRSDLIFLGEGLFLLHIDQPMDRPALGLEETAGVVGLASGALRGYPHPFFTASDLMRNAAARMSDGDYNAAIIESVTAIETFVSSFVRLNLEHRQRGQEQIDNVLNGGLKNLLDAHVARVLGAPFNTRNPTNALDRWYDSAYKLRNEVVHQGILATGVHARGALEQADEVVSFVRAQMDAEPKRFTHIMSFFTPK